MRHRAQSSAKGEDVMRTIMRNAVLAAGLILVCAGGTAQASTSDVVEANVPFPFVVNGENFPSGKYMIERDYTAPSIVMIRGEKNNHAVALVLTMPDEGRDPAGSRPALTFNRSENQYHLATIWQSDREGSDIIGR
jgi:hypothetical protein